MQRLIELKIVSPLIGAAEHWSIAPYGHGDSVNPACITVELDSVLLSTVDVLLDIQHYAVTLKHRK